MSRPPRISNWLPWEQSTVYFMTLCIDRRQSVLATDHAWAICRSTFEKLDQWTIFAAVAMPNHLHVLATPRERDASVSQFAKWFKRWFNEVYGDSKPIDKAAIQWRWQEGCFDRLLRSDESLQSKWEYIRQNP